MEKKKSQQEIYEMCNKDLKEGDKPNFGKVAKDTGMDESEIKKMYDTFEPKKDKKDDEKKDDKKPIKEMIERGDSVNQIVNEMEVPEEKAGVQAVSLFSHGLH